MKIIFGMANPLPPKNRLNSEIKVDYRLLIFTQEAPLTGK